MINLMTCFSPTSTIPRRRSPRHLATVYSCKFPRHHSYTTPDGEIEKSVCKRNGGKKANGGPTRIKRKAWCRSVIVAGVNSLVA
jgi:hypothetical protein